MYAVSLLGITEQNASHNGIVYVLYVIGKPILFTYPAIQQMIHTTIVKENVRFPAIIRFPYSSLLIIL